MCKEIELSADEKKAKEFVEFYYFWLFHYCARNYHLELSKQLSLTSYEDRQYMAQFIYSGHRLSSLYPTFCELDNFTDVGSLFDEGLVPYDDTISLLNCLYNGEQVSRNVGFNQEYGVEIIGTSGTHISNEGQLRGSIIAKIDLRAPNSVILYELSKIRDTKFKVFPERFDAPRLFGLQGNYVHESKIIQQTTKASFSAKDDAARAIGLWCWDTIDRLGVVNRFADAWKLICGDPVPRIHYEEQEEGNHFRWINIDGAQSVGVPSREVIAKLGYSASDPSVFRRLYRNTKRCIEACEVLSLKD